MSSHPLSSSATATIVRAFAAAAALLPMPWGAPVLAQQVTMETLLDRIQIEDLLAWACRPGSMNKAEDTELVKRDDKWLISRRYITAVFAIRRPPQLGRNRSSLARKRRQLRLAGFALE